MFRGRSWGRAFAVDKDSCLRRPRKSDSRTYSSALPLSSGTRNTVAMISMRKTEASTAIAARKENLATHAKASAAKRLRSNQHLGSAAEALSRCRWRKPPLKTEWANCRRRQLGVFYEPLRKSKGRDLDQDHVEVIAGQRRSLDIRSRAERVPLEFNSGCECAVVRD